MLVNQKGTGPLYLNQRARYRKADGTLAHPSEEVEKYYNIEGEAVMRIYDPVILQFNRANSLRRRAERISKDTIAYESWLWSCANLNDGGAPARVVRRWHSRKQKLVKQKVNVLLVCTLLPGESWGRCSKTIEECRDRSTKSQAEKQTNSQGKLQIIHGRKNPINWDSSMSEQRATEGYEHRGRTPSVVEMLARCVRCIRQKNGVISKPRKVAPEAIWMNPDTPVSTLSIIKPQVAANTPRPLAVLVENEKRIRRELKNSVIRSRRSTISRPKVSTPEVERVVEIDGRQEVEISLNMPLWNKCSEYRLYQNTLAAPLGMSAWRYPDSKNFIVPTNKQVREFNKSFPIPLESVEREDAFGLEHWWSDVAPDEARLNSWLLKMSVYTPGLHKSPKRLRLDATPYERRLQFLEYQFKCGRITDPEIYQAARRRLIQANKAHLADVCKNIVAVGHPYGDPKRRSFPKAIVNHKLKGLPSPVVREQTDSMFARQIGLDVSSPMTEMEYDHITRSEPTDIDIHLLSAGIIGIKEFDTGLTAKAEMFKEQQLGIFRARILGDTSIGDTFLMDQGSGLMLPNYESEKVFEIFERISK